MVVVIALVVMLLAQLAMLMMANMEVFDISSVGLRRSCKIVE